MLLDAALKGAVQWHILRLGRCLALFGSTSTSHREAAPEQDNSQAVALLLCASPRSRTSSPGMSIGVMPMWALQMTALSTLFQQDALHRAYGHSACWWNAI